MRIGINRALDRHRRDRGTEDIALLLNCFDGDCGDVIDDGDDDTSKLIFVSEQLVFLHELHSNAKFKDFIVHCPF